MAGTAAGQKQDAAGDLAEHPAAKRYSRSGSIATLICIAFLSDRLLASEKNGNWSRGVGRP